jgi:hypothetical protein
MTWTSSTEEMLALTIIVVKANLGSVGDGFAGTMARKGVTYVLGNPVGRR